MPGQACGLWQEGLRKCAVKHENWPLSSSVNRDSCKSLLGYAQQLASTSSMPGSHPTLSTSVSNATFSRSSPNSRNCFSTSGSISSWLIGHELGFGFILGLVAFASLKITARTIFQWAVHSILSLRAIFGSFERPNTISTALTSGSNSVC